MQTIGERLEEARKRKGVSIREAAEATKIRGDYLHKFENNQFDLSLPEIYVRGFLRTYAVFLKLPGDKIINDYKGLGLGEPKGRGLNRESFGRMDLSVATAKSAAREAAPPPSPSAETLAEGAPQDNNPATFRPRAGAGPQIDQALLVKGLVALAGLAVLVLIVFLLVKLLGGDSGKPSTTQATTASQVAVKPGESTITIYALDKVFVTVRQNDDSLVLFSGALARGESRTVPRRTTIRIDADPYQALDVEYNGARLKMPQRTGYIDPPTPTPAGR